jgi:hypothetical protein
MVWEELKAGKHPLKLLAACGGVVLAVYLAWCWAHKSHCGGGGGEGCGEKGEGGGGGKGIEYSAILHRVRGGVQGGGDVDWGEQEMAPMGGSGGSGGGSGGNGGSSILNSGGNCDGGGGGPSYECMYRLDAPVGIRLSETGWVAEVQGGSQAALLEAEGGGRGERVRVSASSALLALPLQHRPCNRPSPLLSTLPLTCIH